MSAIPLPQFRESVLTLYQPPIRAKATFLKMRRALDSLAELPEVATTDDLTTQTFARWVAARGDANANTTISLLRALRAACRYGVEEGWVERQPVFRRIWPRRQPARKRALGHEDVSRLLAHLEGRKGRGWHEHRLFAVTALVAYTGLRASEALFARVEDVDLARRLFWVSARRRLKTEAAAAPVPLAVDVIPILESWIPQTGSPWLFPGVKRVSPWHGGAHGYRPLDCLKSAAAEIGLEGVTFHGLRHTLATLLLSHWGRTAEQASWMLRHTSPKTTTEHYVHADDLAILLSIVHGVSFRRQD